MGETSAEIISQMEGFVTNCNRGISDWHAIAGALPRPHSKVCLLSFPVRRINEILLLDR